MVNRIRMLAVVFVLGGVAPVLAIQEGIADFRITQVGPALDPDFDAFNPAVAYNSVDEEYLLVWTGAGGAAGLSASEDEIYAQRVRADNGQIIGTAVRVSQMGPDGDIAYQGLDPNVAYNPTANQYLVVWWGDDNSGQLVEDEDEVWGRRLAADGTVLDDQFRISFMGTDGDSLAEGKSPDVIYNSVEDDYFVVWGGDDIDGVFVNQDFEIWGQRVATNSNMLVGSVIRVSDMGEEEGNPSFTAADPDVAFNPLSNEYLVTWEGDDDGGTAVDGEQEIYAQRIDAATGEEVGINDLRVSFLGPEGATDYDGGNAAVVYSSFSGEYLVAWNGSDDQDGAIRNDIEIHVQRLSADGTLVGGARRISAMGPDGTTAYWGLNPALAVSQLTGDYVVTWRGESDEGDLVNNEFEAYAQRLASDGRPLSTRVRISQMGPDGTSSWGLGLPRIAYDSGRERFLVIWDGEDDRPDLAPNEFELFGQFVNLDIVFAAGFE